MSNVIKVDFTRGRCTLDKALEILGEEWFRKAMHEWSMAELTMTVHQAANYPTDAFEAYECILNHRHRENGEGTPAQVIPFPERKKAA